MLHLKARDATHQQEFARPILVFLSPGGTLTDALPSRSKQNTYKSSRIYATIHFALVPAGSPLAP